MKIQSEHLKRVAAENFTEELATEIGHQIDEADALALSGEIKDIDDPKPYSVATAFLADAFYERLKPGKFTGRLHLIWDGMDDFVFSPSEHHAFAFTTHSGRVIRPGLMYTDGGSIPQALRGFKKFSSWGYAPAYIIHDWLFTAKKCKQSPDDNWAFPATAWVMAEAIKTLMEVGYVDYQGQKVKLPKAEDTLYLMYLAVRSSIAKNCWENDGSVKCLPGTGT